MNRVLAKLIVSLTLVIGSVPFSPAGAAGQSSASYRVAADVFAGGGATRVQSASYSLSATVSQRSVSGNATAGGGFTLFPGFQAAIWSGGGAGDIDQDGDSLPDWWEQLYFGGPTNAAPGFDSDGDGHSNFDEYLCGTVPTNKASVFGVGQVSPLSNQWVIVRWSSVDGKSYELQRTTNLLDGFSTLLEGIPASAPENVYTDSVSPLPGTLFYRVKTGL